MDAHYVVLLENVVTAARVLAHCREVYDGNGFLVEAAGRALSDRIRELDAKTSGAFDTQAAVNSFFGWDK